MTSPGVVIVGSEWNGEGHGADAPVWYFGNDYKRFLELTSGGSSRRTVDVGDKINAVARRLRSEFIELDARLASGRFKSSYAATDIAESNPLISDFCLDICRAVALVEAARAGNTPIVAVDDAAFGRALQRVLTRAGIGCNFRSPVLTGLRRAASGLREHVGFFRDWLSMRGAVARHSVDPTKLAGCDVLLMSWNDGTPWPVADSDRFLGLLPDWLRKDGHRIGWLANAVGWMAPIEKIAEAAQANSVREPVVLSGFFHGVESLLKSYARFLMIPMSMRRRLTLDGVDVSPMLALALAREMASPRAVAAGLFASLAMGIKKRGVVPRLLIYTYENQPWERAMLLGFREVLPETRLIGVQHAPLAEQYFSGHPSRRQWKDGSAPDVLVVIGEEFRERLLARGAPPERVLVGGALRFPALYAPAATAQQPAKDKQPMVLASCSVDARESFELVFKAAAATARRNVRLFVNFHPMVNEDFRSAIRAEVGSRLDTGHVEYVEGNAGAYLSEAAALLYNSSGTAFDAAKAGVPLIYVGPEVGLDLDKMSEQGVLCGRSIEALGRHIDVVLKGESMDARIEVARGYLRRCFATPSASIWTEFASQSMKRAA